MCRLSDLVNLNPGASSLRPGASLEVPCYPPDEPFKFGYYGGDVAFGMVRAGLGWVVMGWAGWLGDPFGRQREAGWLVWGVCNCPGRGVAGSRQCCCGPPLVSPRLLSPVLPRILPSLSVCPLAALQFSGGNQQEGPEGLPAAMAAARVNAGIPNQ